MKKIFFVTLCSLCTVMGMADDTVVMTIAGEPVYKSEYDYNYNKNNTDDVVEKMTPRAYADLYAAYKLKVRAAMDAKMDTMTSVKQEFRTYRDKQIRPLLVSEGDMEKATKDYYDHMKDGLQGKDLILPAHIFVRVMQKDPEEMVVAAKARVDSIYGLLRNGADFAQLAAECSDDKGSARQQGIVGWIGPGQTLPEFENAAYAMQIGELSAPVRSAVGYHIIKLINRKELEPYDTLRAPIRQYLERGGLRDRLCRQMVDSTAKAKGITAEEVMDNESDRLCKQDKELDFLVKEYHDGLLLFEISSRLVWEPAKKDTAALENYFNLHKKELMWDKPHFRGMAFSCKDKKDVKAVKKLLKKTPEAEWIKAVRKQFNQDSAMVRMEKKIFVQGQNGIVDELAFKVKDAPKTASKQFPYTGVYGKMLKKGPEVWSDVANQVIDGYQNEKMALYVDELKKRYPVVINEEAFK
jgi:peptidyl-prolyl cis-trans isomerase SurA